MSKTGCVYSIIDYTTLLYYFQLSFQLLLFKKSVPGTVGYSSNKVAVAGTDFKYQFHLKSNPVYNLILFTWNKPAPEQV